MSKEQYRQRSENVKTWRPSFGAQRGPGRFPLPAGWGIMESQRRGKAPPTEKGGVSMKITALVENTTSDESLGKEHGLSLWIEALGHRILFDMGQTDLFARNAALLGIDLAAADLAVLSHGHYDHGGGLAKFLELNQTAPVYLNQHAFEPHYHGSERYIGLDPALASSPRLHFVGDTAEIAPGLTLSTCNGRPKEKDLGSFGLTVEEGGAFRPEDFRHEHYLMIEENGKRVLISGCSHKGILNLVDWFHPDVLVGGFHFNTLPLDDTLAGYAKELSASGARFYTCHCTGRKQYAFMKDYMDRLAYLSTGQTILI